MTHPTEIKLAEIREQRNMVRQQAIALAESDNFSPDDEQFRELETRASNLDRQAETLNDLLGRQKSADQLDYRMSEMVASIEGSRQQTQTRSLPRLIPTREQLSQAAHAIESGQQYRIQLDGLQTRSLVTLPDVGGSIAPIRNNDLPEPRRITTAVGLTAEPVPARGASGPKYGLPTTQPPTGEGELKPEADNITEAALVPVVLARWTDLTLQTSLEVELADVSRWHALFIAQDEDKLVIDALTADAVTVAGGGDPAADIRAAQAQVSANVSAAADLIVCNPADAGLITPTWPSNATDAASPVPTVSGSIIYPSNSQPAGTVLVAALRAVGRFGVAKPVAWALTLTPKTNIWNVMTEEVAGFTIRQAGGVASVAVGDNGS